MLPSGGGLPPMMAGFRWTCRGTALDLRHGRLGTSGAPFAVDAKVCLSLGSRSTIQSAYFLGGRTPPISNTNAASDMAVLLSFAELEDLNPLQTG